MNRIMATKEVKSAERGEATGGMRTDAIVIGIIAGLASLVSAVLALMVGGPAQHSSPKEPASSSAPAGRRWASRYWDS